MHFFSKLKLLDISKLRKIFLFLFFFVLIGALAFSFYQIYQLKNQKEDKLKNFEALQTELSDLKNQDQYKKNEELQKEINNIQKTYKNTVDTYEDILSIEEKGIDVKEFNKLFANALSLLSERNFSSASATLITISQKITEAEKKIAATFKIPENIPVENTPPGKGYSKQQVSTDAGNFMVSMIAADYSSTRVIVDTASGTECFNDCPVLSLATYVSRNGAFAGVNGSYFCPATYPSCSGKTNTFDTLLMNKDKKYFNSDNNVYSNNPAVIFGGSFIRFVSAASQWGRDTSIDSMISNYPLLVFNSNVSFAGDDDPKKGSKGNRSFIAQKGNTVYIGVVYNVTVAESARVMKVLGMENALNLDSGGSTALWSGGYKAGPGRDIPNAILFVNK